MKQLDMLVYITGHGFGHASRTIEVLKKIALCEKSMHFHIRTGAPEWFFRKNMPSSVSYTYHEVPVDVGVLQKGALMLERKGTLQRFASFWKSRDELITLECDEFCRSSIRLVLADIPPLAFEIAERLGVRAAGMGNFSWDWIYCSYTRQYRSFEYLIDEIRNAYGKADLMLRLPFSGDLSAFPYVLDIPLIARQSKAEPAMVRKRMGIPSDRPSALISFGGFPVYGSLFDRLSLMKDWHFITTFPLCDSGVHHISEEELAEAGYSYPDLLNAASLVVGKPGFGIVSECIAHRKPFLYTSRGDFTEYRPLTAGIRKYLPSCYIPKKDLFEGQWEPYLREALSRPQPHHSMRLDGASEAARLILEQIYTPQPR